MAKSDVFPAVLTAVALAYSLLFIVSGTTANTSQCCDLVSRSSSQAGCFLACQRILGDDGVDGDQSLTTEILSTSCPQNLRDFWTCFNRSSLTVESGAGWAWWGRPCCELALKTTCQNACRRARRRNDVTSACSAGDELAVSMCLDRRAEGERCCQLANGDNQCAAVCRRIFIQDSAPTQSQLEAARSACSRQMTTCLYNYSQSIPSHSPANSLPCCDEAETSTCRDGCRAALTQLTAEDEIVDEVSRHCGLPHPSAPMWQCFLRSSTNSIRYQYERGGSIELTGVDGAKLQCCHKAITIHCRDLCIRTYSRDWTQTVQEFQQQCVSRKQELDLNMCLDDVDEQCQLGCSGLEYCSNFNHRPTELFRSCTTRSDDAARTVMRLWESGVISLPLLLPFDIPVKDVRTCRPQMWRSVACTLHIKPCTGNRHGYSICKSDCLTLLNKCLDVARVPAGVTSELICDKIATPDDNPCVSISTYLVSSGLESSQRDDVTTPCNPSPCGNHEMCIVIRHRQHCTSKSGCARYRCRPGCPLGEVMSQMVPRHAYVRIPAPSPAGTRCFRMCKCGRHDLLHQCRPLACVRDDQCQLNYGMIHDHGHQFEVGCNNCVCFASDAVCTTRHCLSARPSSDELKLYTGLPCNCPAHYIPVCGVNGQTFPNSCIASCNGLTSSQIKVGSCESLNPCTSNPCQTDETCVRRRRVCISHKLKEGDCKQFECVRAGDGCRRGGQHDVVCDITGDEFHSICQLVRRGAHLAYHGHCLVGCDETVKVVCGVDGNSYQTECAAWASNVPVDYIGPCRTVAFSMYNQTTPASKCAGVTCPMTSHGANCQPITPPGACCPICAGEIRVLVSRRLLSDVEHAGLTDPVTVADVVDVLRLQLTVAECDVFVYPSFESDLVILVLPITPSPTAIQVEACIRETENLGSLLTSSSPVVATYIPVSVFVSVIVRTSVGPTSLTSSVSADTATLTTVSPYIHLVTTLLLTAVLALSLSSFGSISGPSPTLVLCDTP